MVYQNRSVHLSVEWGGTAPVSSPLITIFGTVSTDTLGNLLDPCYYRRSRKGIDDQWSSRGLHTSRSSDQRRDVPDKSVGGPPRRAPAPVVFAKKRLEERKHMLVQMELTRSG